MTAVGAILGVLAPRPLISATASPSTLTKNGGTSFLVTASTTVTVVGGVLPLSHSWADISASGINITSPSSDTTTFSATLLNSGDNVSGLFVDTLTDATGAHIDSNQVSVLITRT